MIRRKLPSQNLLLFSFNGGLGDYISRIPVFDYMAQRKQGQYEVVCRDFLIPLYEKCLGHHKNLKFLPSTKYHTQKYLDYTQKERGWVASDFSLQRMTVLRTHMQEHQFMRGLDEQVTDPKVLSFKEIDFSKVDLTRFNLPQRYIALHVGSQWLTRVIPPEISQQIIEHYEQKEGLSVVYFGRSSPVNNHLGAKGLVPQAEFNGGINLVNKTSLLEMCAMLQGAQAVVSADSGPVWAAALSSAPIVTTYNIAEAKHRLPYRRGVKGWNVFEVDLSKRLQCWGCQGFIGHSDWRWNYEVTESGDPACYYNDFKCLKMQSLLDWQLKIDQALEEDERDVS